MRKLTAWMMGLATLATAALAPATTDAVALETAQPTPNQQMMAYRTDPVYSITMAARQPLATYYPSPADWGNEVIYQIITDRFDNGDPSNDRAHPLGNFNPTDRGGIHGGDYAGIRARLPYLAELGVTAIWIAPVHLNTHGQYHGYHAFDFEAVDPRFGTLEDLRELIREAHALGIRVMIDVVCNHLGNLTEQPGAEGFLPPPARNEIKWRGDLRYHPPFDTLDAFNANGSAVYDTPLGPIYGDIYALDDIRTERPDLREYLIRVFKDLITATDCDGFRVDTTKHVEADFWWEWNKAIQEHAASLGKKDFYIVGEVWQYEPEAFVKFLLDDKGNRVYDGILDFPNQGASGSVFATLEKGPAAIRELDESTNGIYPAGAKRLMGTFLDNHDMERFLRKALNATENNDAVSEARLRAALAWMLTIQGVPIVYYGTEQGFAGIPGGRSWANSRENMFAGQYTHGPSEGDSFRTTNPLFGYTQALIKARLALPALRSDHTEWLVAEAEPGLMAYVRGTEGERVLVAINTAAEGNRDLADVRAALPGLEELLPVVLGPQQVLIFDLAKKSPVALP